MKNSNHLEPTLKNTGKIDENITKENNDKDLNIEIENQENKTLEIPAFLRRQVN